MMGKITSASPGDDCLFVFDLSNNSTYMYRFEQFDGTQSLPYTVKTSQIPLCTTEAQD
jgi:hypothetical protein